MVEVGGADPDWIGLGWTGFEATFHMILHMLFAARGADRGVGNDKECYFYPRIDRSANKGKLRDPRTPGLMIEVLASGRKVWKYERRLTAVGAYVRLALGRFPARTLADARAWAATLNEQVEAGIDPREAARAADAGLA